MTRAHLSPALKTNAHVDRRGGRVLALVRSRAAGALLLVALMLPLLGDSLSAAPSDPWTRGTGMFSNTTLGALKDSSAVNRQWPATINYDVDLNSWAYDVYVPAGYDGTKPYGVMVYTTSDATTGVVLQTAANDKNLIWIAPRYVGNSQDYTYRFGVTLLALYRAKELFNIDPRRVYTSGKSGGARVASALAFYHSELIKGTAPSSGFCLPRLNEVTPDYITNSSGQADSYFDYSNLWFFGEDTSAISATAKTNKLRSYIITRYDDYRGYYFTESFHCAYEPQGQTCFLYYGPGTHQDATDSEMEEAIDYLDRDDIFPVNANITAGTGGFSGMTSISQSGASAVEATSGNGNNAVTTYTLTPTLTAVAAAKTVSTFYWDNANGSTVRWLWEVKNAAPTNQKTCFGLWFANETWGGGAPVSVTAGNNPGILITITQNGSQNRMVISARPDSGGETVFYDGYFSFVGAYSTAWTSTQTGYLTGTGSPVEIRMDLNKSRWQLTFNGINLNGATNSIASGTQIGHDKTNNGDDKRLIFGYWNTAVGGSSFWKHDIYTAASNTWSPFTKSIFTAATGALSGAGTAPSPMELRYVIASDPNLPDPPAPGPTGLAATSSNGVVNLTWNTVAGATSYTLQRSSVSGGPYTTIQSGITGTSYTDSTVTSGNIYYYTIFANTASGDTAIVPEVAAGAGFQLDTWSGNGADNNWQTAANWTALPVAGDSLVFAGTSRLSNTNNFSAGTSFRDLTFSSGAGAFTLGGNAITLTRDVTNNGTTAQTVNLPVALASGAHSLAANTGNLSLGGVISGTGSVSKSGSGMATLSAANSYSGGTVVNSGELKVSMPTTTGTLTIVGTGTVTTNGGLLHFIPTGGTASTETFANNFVLNGGTITSEDGNTLLGLSTNTISATGATTLQRMWGHVTTKSLQLNGLLSGSAALTLQGTGGAANEGASIWINNANNSYSGTLTVNAGVGTGGFAMVDGANNALQFANINLNGTRTGGSTDAALLYGVQFASGVTAPVLGSLAGNGNINLVDLGNNPVALSVGSNGGTTTFSGILSGGGSLAKTSNGTLALTGANTYTGGTTISGGTLGLANANGANTNLGAGSVTVNTGAILRVGYSVTSNQNISTTANAITLAGGSILADDANQHLSGAVTVSASGGILGSTYNAGNNSAAEKDKGLALDGVVSGTGALIIQHTRINTGNSYDTSFVSFSNNSNTYSGTLTINENTATTEGGVYLGVNGGTALQNATVATSAIPGGNLKFGSSPVVFKTALGSATIGAISGSGPLVLTGYDQVNHAYGTDAIALTVGGNNVTTAYSAAISGLGSLAKTGTGTLTLSGTNTYAGATTISGGILNITGALGSNSGTVTVNNGGTLGGTGTVARAITVAGGGAIAPGNGGTGAAGTLTLSGGLTLNDGAVLKLDLAGTSTSDKLAVSGTFAASGTTMVNLTALGGFAGSGTYPLITGASGISAANFAVGATPPGYVGTLGASGGTLSLTVMTQLEAWRQTNFGTTANSGNAADSADPDGDGMTNAQEFATGTNPNDSASLLKVSALTADGANFQVSFPSVAGKTYRVERSDTLQAGSWVSVQDNIAGTGGILQVTDIDGAIQPRRFYRIVLLP